jgi:subtilisin family serine protease
VAVVDTGLGKHHWFDGDDARVIHHPTVGGEPIGIEFPPGQDPEVDGVTLDLVNRFLDPMAGHGTFIAGLVRQHCPSATILAVPVMYGDGAADEADIIDALQRLLLWHWVGLDGAEKHPPLDVVSLSFGYYHETPSAVEDEAGLFKAVRTLQENGVCVVAAAGNGATTLPFWPAALAAEHAADIDRKRVPVLSVGARNPNDGTVAAFSNTGDWVHTYRCGVAVVSTMPQTFDGSLRGSVNVPASGGNPERGTPDPDDYSSGFGIWSGSSFASPACAGDMAHMMCAPSFVKDDRSRVEKMTEIVERAIKEEG